MVKFRAIRQSLAGASGFLPFLVIGAFLATVDAGRIVFAAVGSAALLLTACCVALHLRPEARSGVAPGCRLLYAEGAAALLWSVAFGATLLADGLVMDFWGRAAAWTFAALVTFVAGALMALSLFSDLE